MLVTNVRGVAPAGEEAEVTVGAAAANYANPLGRVSLRRPKPNALERASLVCVSTQQCHTKTSLNCFQSTAAEISRLWPLNQLDICAGYCSPGHEPDWDSFLIPLSSLKVAM
jgi:hypothetical protein